MFFFFFFFFFFVAHRNETVKATAFSVETTVLSISFGKTFLNRRFTLNGNIDL